MRETSRHSRRRRAVAIIGLLAVVAVTSGCGSRRDAQEFVVAAEAAGGGGVVQTTTSTGAADPAAAAAAPAPGVAVPDAPSAPVDGAPAAGPAVDTPAAPGGVAPAAPSGDAPAAPGGGDGGAEKASGQGGANAQKQSKAEPRAAGNSCATSGSTITLGNISTQSGLLGELFKGLPESLQVWAAAANACGGLGGHPVRVISGDDGGDPATALTIAKRMVENDKVLGFVGLIMPLSVAGIEKYLAEVGVPSIGGDSSELPFFENPMFFPIGPFVSVIGAADAKIAIDRGAKKLAVFYCTEIPNSCGPVAASKELQVGSETVKRLGGEVVISQKASVVAPSFTSQCIAAKRAGAQAIIAILDGPSVGRMATNCEAQDYKPLFLGISLGLSANLIEFPALNNNFFAPLNTYPFPDSSIPATKKFQADVQRYFGRPLSGPSPALGYASGMLAAEAAKGGLPANPTPADMVKALYTIKNNDLGGLVAPLTFTRALPREGITSCYFLLSIANGNWAAPEGAKCLPVDVQGPQ